MGRCLFAGRGVRGVHARSLSLGLHEERSAHNGAKKGRTELLETVLLRRLTIRPTVRNIGVCSPGVGKPRRKACSCCFPATEPLHPLLPRVDRHQ